MNSLVFRQIYSSNATCDAKYLSSLFNGDHLVPWRKPQKIGLISSVKSSKWSKSAEYIKENEVLKKRWEL